MSAYSDKIESAVDKFLEEQEIAEKKGKDAGKNAGMKGEEYGDGKSVMATKGKKQESTEEEGSEKEGD